MLTREGRGMGYGTWNRRQDTGYPDSNTHATTANSWRSHATHGDEKGRLIWAVVDTASSYCGRYRVQPLYSPAS